MATYNLDDILKLPPNERIQVAQAIWDSLDTGDHEAATEIDDELRAELDRRWASYQANPGSRLSLEELDRRLKEHR
jgi:putative addiction module component (TIGR02574 family)